jgi:oxygen-independent coproporphyrinogen III oxidase
MPSESNPLSLYLHIPFCSTKCSYCAFNTYTHLDHLIDAFVTALAGEAAIVGRGQSVGTIFFGGGTPSLLTPPQYERIFYAINNNFNVIGDAEISLEANPNDLNREYLAALRQIGFNRLSVGMQTVNPNELKLFNRRHDNDAVAQAMTSARGSGFDNVNLDLIYGFPHQTMESWETTLRQMLHLKPEHVSLYALGLEDGTAMKAWVETGRLPTPDDDLAADMYELASEILAAHGYEQYEISNWARPGRQCRHNLQYWLNLPYVGLGPGAHGYADGVRYSVILSPQRYIKLMEETSEDFEFPLSPATDQAETIQRDGEIAETLIMGLRLTQQGIERRTFADRFGADLLDIHGGTIQRFEDHGLLSVDDERVHLTEQGRLLSNVIFRELV